MAVDQNDESLDIVLTEVGGFGVYQGYTYFLICLLNLLSAFSTINYMVSANTLEHRCKVNECDIGGNNRGIEFDQPWLHKAIPYSDDKIDSCYRYAPKNRTIDEYGLCSADIFDTSKEIKCSEFVYESDETNLQTEFNIHCADSYKLGLIGAVGNIGRFTFLPVFGLLSDKYGRIPGLLIGTMLASVFALIKSFSINYSMYIIFEFLEASASSAILTTPYILAVEWLNPKYRILGNTIISLSFPTGEMLFGLAAMYVHDFRTLIRILHIPGLFVFIYFWLIPESVRWLLTMGRIDEAIPILRRIAKVNRKELSEKSIEMLKLHYESKSDTKMRSTEKGNHNDDENQSVIQSLRLIFKSKTFSFRLFNCCYQWAASNFSYYGLGLTAMHISGSNHYVSFIIVMASEIPGYLLSQPLLSRMKRRVLMFSMSSLGAVSMIAIPFVPKEHSTIVIILFIVGKAAITCAAATSNVFIMEQWPTNIRGTVLNTSSMIGRFGSMLAPLTMVLATQSAALPNLLFGGTAILSAILILFAPETYGKKLPDTMEEANNL